MECEIIQTPIQHDSVFLGEFLPANRYVILIPGRPSHVTGGYWNAEESQLRKRPQPGIPDEVRALFDVPRKVGEPA